MSAPERNEAATTLEVGDGSAGTIRCLANGDRRIPEERVEALCGERVLQSR